ncbi:MULTISPECIES: restriction endonuclease subunit S [unclassified Providencia]|uniref:restriction endonuclease subunit S n=1 Tax=unclassified Providencia TaxID=2633465 RepID=UPI00234A4FF8|nr:MULTISPECIES: restriction endonuclease subunit S [unclassified Providencia]WOB84889.1 restriction endonuclease subunit S [Providencia sp. PROV040]
MTNLSGINLNNGSAVGSKREGMDSPSKDLALMPRYEAYKDSYSDYSGLIPCEWKLIPIRAIFEERNEKNTGPKTDHILSVTRDRGVIPYDEKGAIGNNKSEDIERYKLVYENDLVINKMNVVIGSLGLSKYFGALSQVYIVLRPKTKSFNIRYYAYLFHNEPFYKSLIRYCTGIMELRESLNKEQFKQLYLPFPTFEEQTLIANFLDMKTAQIDEAIAIKEQQISLLKERKQIIIQQVVTQGLDPNVPMKDSGVDWIGKIPAHWVLKKIKHVTSKIGSGVTPTGGGSTYLDDGIPLLRSQNIHFDRIDLTDVARISNKTHEGMSNSKVKKGDVLLNITGGSIGRCYYVDSSDEMNVNQHVCIVRPNKIIKTVFLNAVLASEIGQGQIWYFQQGGGREGLNFQALKNFYIALPPEAQQVEIAEYIDELEKEFYSAIQIQLMQIEKLKEYKTTLINSAVTGKIKITPEMVEQ